MTIRKRRNPTSAFKIPPPYQPITGEMAALATPGIFPYVAMMQVAAEDTREDYVLCRGFDIRICKFVDYAEDDETKPGIPVGKPFGNRKVGAYKVGEIFPAVLPLQTPNSSPVSVPWRVGQNPGWATGGCGQPTGLEEEVDFLRDENDEYVNWLLLDGGGGGDELVELCLLEDHPGRGIEFSAIKGTWNETTNCWVYDSEGEDPCAGTETVTAIDWRFGAPYPASGAKGLFVPRPSSKAPSSYTTIYECVSLDCESPGDCCDYGGA